jgi:membrane protease YdiL (CAAX protease family)
MLGSVSVAVDMWLSWGQASNLEARFILGSSAAGALVLLAGGDWRALGLSPRPVRGFWYWAKASAIAAIAILALSLLVVAVVPELWGLTVERGHELWHAALWPRLMFSCFQTPIVEELLYRGVLCASLVQAIGRTPTVVLSGTIFAFLHYIYGNPGPDNAVAGFILAWAFIASESLLIPILMHAGGNLLVLLIQLTLSAVTG